MTIRMEELGEALGQMMADVGGDPLKVDELIKRKLGEFGFDPDATFSLANTIVAMAVQAGEAPEQTIVATFQMGLVLGAQLGVKP